MFWKWENIFGENFVINQFPPLIFMRGKKISKGKIVRRIFIREIVKSVKKTEFT